MAIIYLLRNTENGKRYVGKTRRPLEVRWRGHLASARRGDTRMLISRALTAHGAIAFERQVLEECADDVLETREIHWIRELHSHVSEGGYNLTFGGDGGLPGYSFSAESREKIRQKALGRKLSPEARAKISATHKGRPKSTEEIANRAAACRGKKRTPEQRANLSAGQFKRWQKAQEN
jgi:group I intron endonuclease